MRSAECRSGFTLIEVMAAAVILSLVVLALTTATRRMTLAEGDARRRADAALIADRLLAELEENALRGAAVQLGKREQEEGIFLATIEVTPLDPALLALASGSPEPAEPVASPAASAAATGWLAAPSAAENPPVLQASVLVTGIDGVFAEGVTRTTFFLNPVALEALGQDAASESESEDQPL